MTTTSHFQCAEQGPKETFADTKLCEARSVGEEGKKSQRNPLNINLDFSQWLEALFIALKYKRGISKEPSQPPNSGESQPADAEPEPEPLPTLTRFYTCPLDQVVEELDQLHHDGASFSRLPTTFITLSAISGSKQPTSGCTWSRRAVSCLSPRPSTRS